VSLLYMMVVLGPPALLSWAMGAALTWAMHPAAEPWPIRRGVEACFGGLCGAAIHAEQDVSLGAAEYHAERVARARGLPVEAVRTLIEGRARRPGGPLTPDAVVNVLELNIALDRPR
jgi:K+-transporting ATPase ATPase C chain